jgi:uridine kinase
MRKVIGLAGPMGSGKGTVAKYLVEKYLGSSHRFSDIMKNILHRLYLDNSRENLPVLSLAVRKAFGEDIFSKIITKDVENDRSEVVVVDGIRRQEDIKHLKKLDGFKLIYIEADIKKRYNRIVKRDEKTNDSNKTFEEFQKEHTYETETSIPPLKKEADFVIKNDGVKEELYKKIDKIIGD